METISCPGCSAANEPGALRPVTYGEAAKATLKDWRVWLFAFGVTIAFGMLSGGLNVGQRYVGAVSGGLIGVFLMLRMGRLRRCPACNATITIPLVAKKAA